MLLDNFITIGKSHNICEDYSLIGDNDNPFLCISDGCSSSKNTDMGARLLCWAYKDFVSWNTESCSHISIGKYLIKQASRIAKDINLNYSALDATLGIIRIINNNVMFCFYGDGYVIKKYKDGDIIIDKISYRDNAPFYLNIFNNSEIIKKWSGLYPNNILKIESFCIDSMSTEISKQNGMIYYKDSCMCEFLDSLYIATDGLGSFINNLGDSLGIKEVVKDLLDIKIRNGEYLKRRMKKMLLKYQALGYTNYDDIAIASIIF